MSLKTKLQFNVDDGLFKLNELTETVHQLKDRIKDGTIADGHITYIEQEIDNIMTVFNNLAGHIAVNIKRLNRIK